MADFHSYRPENVSRGTAMSPVSLARPGVSVVSGPCFSTPVDQLRITPSAPLISRERRMPPAAGGRARMWSRSWVKAEGSFPQPGCPASGPSLMGTSRTTPVSEFRVSTRSPRKKYVCQAPFAAVGAWRRTSIPDCHSTGSNWPSVVPTGPSRSPFQEPAAWIRLEPQLSWR
ncbi:hypothetical protein [Streptomyces sp. NPDC001889]